MVLKKMAVIENNVVTNIVLWDGIKRWEPGPDIIILDATNLDCEIGMVYSEEGALVDLNGDGIPDAVDTEILVDLNADGVLEVVKPNIFKRILNWFSAE
jgi:hypothetical protein